VAPGHAWTCVTHDLPNLFALLLFVTMDGAIVTGWFCLTIGTLCQALFRVAHQLIAATAQLTSVLAMMVFTVYFRHAHHGLVLTF
jgi:hypothetical protein